MSMTIQQRETSGVTILDAPGRIAIGENSVALREKVREQDHGAIPLGDRSNSVPVSLFTSVCCTPGTIATTSDHSGGASDERRKATLSSGLLPGGPAKYNKAT
jgi:hypothetical protein